MCLLKRPLRIREARGLDGSFELVNLSTFLFQDQHIIGNLHTYTEAQVDHLFYLTLRFRFVWLVRDQEFIVQLTVAIFP